MNITVEGRASRPNKRQCAMLIVHLLAKKQKEVGTKKEINRARLSENSPRSLFGRQRISPKFLLEVQEWLFRAGWVLFSAGTTYAVVKMKIVEGWGRISSNRIDKDLAEVSRGEFKLFDRLEHHLLGSQPPGEDND